MFPLPCPVPEREGKRNRCRPAPEGGALKSLPFWEGDRGDHHHCFDTSGGISPAYAGKPKSPAPYGLALAPYRGTQPGERDVPVSRRDRPMRVSRLARCLPRGAHRGLDSAGSHGSGNLSAAARPREGIIPALLLGRVHAPARDARAPDRRARKSSGRPSGRVRLQPLLVGGRAGAGGQARNVFHIEGRRGPLAIGQHRRETGPDGVRQPSAPQYPGGSAMPSRNAWKPGTIWSSSRKGPPRTARACCRSAPRFSPWQRARIHR